MTLEIFREDAYRAECTASVQRVCNSGVELDQSVFYCQGGGQPGDAGILVCEDARQVRVIDTRADGDSGTQLHILGDGEIPPQPGEVITARIDWERRHRVMRMHSCMHMLCALVDAPVTGGSIADGRGRLDFDLPEPLDKLKLTDQLNAMICQDRPMRLSWITDEELDQQPDLVKTMSVGPPRGVGRIRLVEFEGVDLQPCGGTHVARSGEIGSVIIQKIEKKGRQNRRVIVRFADPGEVV